MVGDGGEDAADGGGGAVDGGAVLIAVGEEAAVAVVVGAWFVVEEGEDGLFEVEGDGGEGEEFEDGEGGLAGRVGVVVCGAPVGGGEAVDVEGEVECQLGDQYGC